MPYGFHPEVEILSYLDGNDTLSVKTYDHAVNLLAEAIHLIPLAPAKEIFDFDIEGLLRDIKMVTKEIPQTIETLKYLEDNSEQFIKQNRLNFKQRIIDNFRENPRPLDTRCIGVRILNGFRFHYDEVYYYQNMYATIFSNVLLRFDIRLPGYKEIYFNLVNTLEEATDISTDKDNWYQYTHAIFDYARFTQSTKEEKEQLFLDCLVEGLRFITDFDHLEKDKIEEVIQYIQKYKLQTPLIYAKRENENYEVHIQYYVAEENIIGNLVKANYELYIFQKETGEERVIPLGIFDTSYVPYVLGNIRLTKKQITIKGRTGLRAEILRSSEDAPNEFQYQFKELFTNKN